MSQQPQDGIARPASVSGVATEPNPTIVVGVNTAIEEDMAQRISSIQAQSVTGVMNNAPAIISSQRTEDEWHFLRMDGAAFGVLMWRGGNLVYGSGVGLS